MKALFLVLFALSGMAHAKEIVCSLKSPVLKGTVLSIREISAGAVMMSLSDSTNPNRSIEYFINVNSHYGEDLAFSAVTTSDEYFDHGTTVQVNIDRKTGNASVKGQRRFLKKSFSAYCEEKRYI